MWKGMIKIYEKASSCLGNKCLIMKYRFNSQREREGASLYAAAAKLLQSCPTLCDSIDDSPSGSPVLGILQARILEWVAISFSNAYMQSKSIQ